MDYTIYKNIDSLEGKGFVMLGYRKLYKCYIEVPYKKLLDPKFLGALGIAKSEIKTWRNNIRNAKGSIAWVKSLYEDSIIMYVFEVKRQNYPVFGILLLATTDEAESSVKEIATDFWKRKEQLYGTQIRYPLSLPFWTKGRFIPLRDIRLNLRTLIKQIELGTDNPITTVLPETLAFFLSNPQNQNRRLEVYRDEKISIYISGLQFPEKFPCTITVNGTDIICHFPYMVWKKNIKLPWLYIFVNSGGIIPGTDVSKPLSGSKKKKEIVKVTSEIAERF